MDKRQDKKAQFEQGTGNKKSLFIVAALLLLVGLGAGVWLLQSPATGTGGHFTAVTAEHGRVAIPAADLADGRARFYSYAGKGGEIEFFLVKSDDGVIRAAFDSCDVCFRERKGYRQEGNLMVCNNCDQAFPTGRINDVKGGCNPAPLKRQMEDGRVVIHTADLESGRRYFAVAAN